VTRPKNPMRAIRANARRDWYRIRNEADKAKPTQVLIYGEIGDSWWGDSVPAATFAREFAAIEADEIHLHIHSPGGDAFDGLAIATAIRNHPAKTVAYVDGLAASAASYIAIAADETVMAVGSEMMVHDASGLALGNAAAMTKMAEILNGLSDNIASLYALKAGGTTSEWRDVMREETWYNADETVKAGLADRVDKEAPAADLADSESKDSAPAEEEQAPVEDQFDLSLFAHRGRRNAPPPRFTGRARAHASGRAGGTTQPKEGAGMDPDFEAGLRQRLGISADAAIDERGFLAALDEALSERAAPTAQAPAGTVLIDEQALADLRAAADDGRQARAVQLTAERNALLDSAVANGQIPPARREHWSAQLQADPGAASVLAALPKNTIPVEPLGYTGNTSESSDDDRIFAAAGWGAPKGA
jgi:ATP-dependent protease ClpP protease subunit